MKTSLGIQAIWFDQIRRGVKKVEYRPLSDFYINRFKEKYITEIEFYNTAMCDRLLCAVDSIREKPLPLQYREAWLKIYSSDGSEGVYHIALSQPRYFVDSVNKKNLPKMFG